jgi:glycosyltransferase involved in cell wall biosynthesis
LSDSVNVIIPTYNMHEYIIESVNSALAQENVNVEIIVVDDGSTDGTRELLAQNKLLDKVKYVYQENGGLSAARNTGLKYAKCEYCCFLDADDLLEPTFCCELIDYMQKTESNIVYSDFSFFFDNKTYSKKRYNLNSYSGDVFGKFISGNFVVVNALLFRRSVLKYDFRTNFLCEDWPYWAQLSVDYQFLFFPKVLAKVRIRPKSMSSHYLEMSKSAIIIMNDFMQYIDENIERISKYELSFYYYQLSWYNLDQKQFRQAFLLWRKAVLIQNNVVMTIKLLVKSFLMIINSYLIIQFWLKKIRLVLNRVK